MRQRIDHPTRPQPRQAVDDHCPVPDDFTGPVPVTTWMSVRRAPGSDERGAMS